MEKKLVSARFGGTVDFYGKVDGQYTILDFKTSKQAYSSMFLQLAGYCYMLEQQGLQVDQVAIINVNIDKYKERFISREDLQPYIETFIMLVVLFHKWHDLNASDGWGSILDK
jgi:predicted RecB family nuclease